MKAIILKTLEEMITEGSHTPLQSCLYFSTKMRRLTKIEFDMYRRQPGKSQMFKSVTSFDRRHPKTFAEIGMLRSCSYKFDPEFNSRTGTNVKTAHPDSVWVEYNNGHRKPLKTTSIFILETSDKNENNSTK